MSYVSSKDLGIVISFLILAFVLVYLRLEEPTFVGCLSGPPCWLSKEYLPIMTLRSFIIGLDLTLLLLEYHTQELIIICAAVTDVI